MNTQGITSLPNLGILEISGPDAQSFLQGQVTCHMGALPENQAQLAGHCNLKGRLQSLFYVVQKEQSPSFSYYLVMPRKMVPFSIQHFKKYALFSKINLTDQSDKISVMGFFGNATHEIGTSWQFPGNTPRWIGFCESNPPPSPELCAAWEEIDVESGLPMIEPETIDRFLPHHLNLDTLGGISFNKGCYLGQEIIARMHYKGNIRKHLYKKWVVHPSRLLPGMDFEEGIIVRTFSRENKQLILNVLDDSIAISEHYSSPIL